MVEYIDITDLIERLEPFETRLAVSLDALFGSISGPDCGGDYTVTINGELKALEGDYLLEDIQLIAVVYDLQGRVIKIDTHNIWADNFFCFEAFTQTFYLMDVDILKIRLYPKSKN